jgi:hypothetical protein
MKISSTVLDISITNYEVGFEHAGLFCFGGSCKDMCVSNVKSIVHVNLVSEITMFEN